LLLRPVLGPVVLCALTRSLSVEAAQPTLELEAPSHCPNEAEFAQFVASRLHRDGTVETETSFEVRVELLGARHVATLTAISAEGSSAERTLADPSCVELLKSVAFVIALAVEEERAELAASRMPASSPPATAAPPPPTPSATVAPVRPARPDTEASRAETSPTEAQAPPATHVAVVFGVRGTAAPAPEFSPALRLGASLRLAALSPSVSFQASALRTFEQSASVDPAEPERGASFTWTAGALEACVGTTVDPAMQVQLDACLGAEIGVLSASGEGVTPDYDRDRFWLSAVGLGRLRFPAATPLGVELEAGASLPFTRDRFVIEGPKAQVFRAPELALSVGLALSLRVL
jgi:hypothetical protein